MGYEVIKILVIIFFAPFILVMLPLFLFSRFDFDSLLFG